MGESDQPLASPVVSRRWLAAELRRLRHEAGKTLEEAADHLECSPAKISRIEGGQVGARIQDVRDLLDLYGASSDQRSALLALARQARTTGWWDRYADLLRPELRMLAHMEDIAATLGTFENHLVPGLLQTPGYARAIMGHRPDVPLDDVERGLAVRLRRQQILTRPTPPTYHVVIDEAVLRRGIGAPGVMDEQYTHLIAMAGKPAIFLQVLPFAAGADAGGSHTFDILSFANLAEPRVVYTELLTDSYFITKAEKVGRYLAQFDQYRGHALDPTDSIELIRRIRAGGGG